MGFARSMNETSSFAWNSLRLKIVQMQFVSALLPMPRAETTWNQTHEMTSRSDWPNVLKVFVFFPVYRNCHYIARGTCDLKIADLRLKREIKTHHHNSTLTIKTFWNSSDFWPVAPWLTRGRLVPFGLSHVANELPIINSLIAFLVHGWLHDLFLLHSDLHRSGYVVSSFFFPNQHIEYVFLWIYFRTARNKKFLLRNKCEGQSPPEGTTMIG